MASNERVVPTGPGWWWASHPSTSGNFVSRIFPFRGGLIADRPGFIELYELDELDWLGPVNPIPLPIPNPAEPTDA